jgi:hypothetical protein
MVWDQVLTNRAFFAKSLRDGLRQRLEAKVALPLVSSRILLRRKRPTARPTPTAATPSRP